MELPEFPEYAIDVAGLHRDRERILVLDRWQYQVSVPSAPVTMAMLP